MVENAFEITHPLPKLRNTHAFSTVIPWIDVGGVGTLVLDSLIGCVGAKEVGMLRRPSYFFDLTRYRPVLTFDDKGNRRTLFPNTTLHYARYSNTDYLFLKCLEPHHFGEDYADCIVEALVRFDTKRYIVLGSMGTHQPHTRPLKVSGSADNESLRKMLENLNVKESGYQGPTTPLIMVSEKAREMGIETMGMIVHIPPYLNTDEDYMGQYTLLKLLSSLYRFPIKLDEIKEKGDKLYKQLDTIAENNSHLKQFISHLEIAYDSQEQGRLSPEVERFIRDVSKRLGQN